MPRAALAFLLALVALPGVARAGAAPVRVLPAPLPTLHVTGAARVSDVRVEVTCTGSARSAECTVHATLTLTATADAALARTTTDARVASGELVVDGTALGAEPRTLAAGASAHVVITSMRSLRVASDWPDAPWVVGAMLVRHPFFGESEEISYRADSFGGTPLDGTELTFDGPVHVDAHGARDASVRVSGSAVETTADVAATQLSIDVGLVAPRPVVSLVRMGGPILAAGARFDLSRPDDGGRFLLRAGFEAGMTEWLFGSVALETDFDSIMESLLVEVAAPEIFFFIPSTAVGLGVVARELGPRDADVGMRVHGQMNLSVLGLSVDGDYWPSIGQWTMSLALRLSI